MQSKIMVGKLCVGFGGNALARCGCIMGQRQIFFVELLGVAAQLYIWAIGFIGGVAVWHIWLCVSITTTATTATALRILRLSHNTCLPVISLLFAGCADKECPAIGLQFKPPYLEVWWTMALAHVEPNEQ